jgi:hypothetical protein
MLGIIIEEGKFGEFFVSATRDCVKIGCGTVFNSLEDAIQDAVKLFNNHREIDRRRRNV